MSAIVAKFGGSVLDGVEGYARVSDELRRLRSDYDTVLAVVSAGKGVTDRLISRIAGNDANLLNQALMGVSCVPEFDTPDISRILISGEWESVRNLVSVMRGMARGVVQDSSYPIVAEGSFLCGKVLFGESERRFARADYNSGWIYVIAGYGAVNVQGNVVLLGRNASDYVAALFAGFCGAEKLVFYKDVDGIYSNWGNGSQKKLDSIRREELAGMGSMKVLDSRVLNAYKGAMEVRRLDSIGSGTLITA